MLSEWNDKQQNMLQSINRKWVYSQHFCVTKCLLSKEVLLRLSVSCASVQGTRVGKLYVVVLSENTKKSIDSLYYRVKTRAQFIAQKWVFGNNSGASVHWNGGGAGGIHGSNNNNQAMSKQTQTLTSKSIIIFVLVSWGNCDDQARALVGDLFTGALTTVQSAVQC